MLSGFFTKLLLKLLWLRYNYPYKIEIIMLATYLGNPLTLGYNEANVSDPIESLTFSPIAELYV